MKDYPLEDSSSYQMSDFRPLQTFRTCGVFDKMEPWFEWSWPVGIKPIHRNGWILAAGFWVIEGGLLFATVGAFHLAPFIQAVAAFLFMIIGITIFVLTASRFKDS